MIENKERIHAKKSLTLTDQFLEVSEEESVNTNNMLDSNQPENNNENRNTQSDKKLKIVRLSNLKKLKKKKIDAISEVDSEEMVLINYNQIPQEYMSYFLVAYNQYEELRKRYLSWYMIVQRKSKKSQNPNLIYEEEVLYVNLDSIYRN